MTDTTTPKQENWWEAFQAPRAKCAEITGDELMTMFDDMDIKPEPKNFLLVDVRRNDWEGGTIKTSMNLPAQSFYQTRKVLFDLCERAGIQKVIFYCGACNGRGPRCAAWMQDYIEDVAKMGRKAKLQSFILKGGIKAWVKNFEGSMVDGYDEKFWTK